MDEQQKKYIQERLQGLIPIFAQASIGDFSKDVPVSDADDGFGEVYAGIQVMLNVIRDKVAHLETEIEQHKQMQELLQSKEERFKALIEKNYDAISLTDATGKITYVSPTFTKILGYVPEEIVGKLAVELIDPEDVKRATEVSSQIIGKQGQSASVEIRCKHKDGSMRTIEVTATNLLENPHVGAIVSNFHDVTERTIIQETLAKEKAEDEAILANIGEGLIVVDKEGKIELINYVAEQILGWSTKDAAGEVLVRILEMEDETKQTIELEDRPMTRALATGEKITGTYYYTRKDGTKFPAAVTVTPLIIAGKIVGSIEIFRDITREKELDKAKDEFISLASHELRTPMTAVKGLISMILHGDYGQLSDELKKPLENIRLSSERQIHLINDLLDISRLQTGKINYKLSTFTLKPALTEVVESLQALAKEKEVTLVVKEVDEIVVQGDIDWVKQIVNNLIGNALKFTEKAGEISVSTRLEGDFDLVVVVDTGIGIDPGDQDKLFESFRQLNTTSNRSVGSGLGLYISRAVARKMGGDVRLEKSTLGEGSTFVFSLPKADTDYAKQVKENLQKEMQIAFNPENR